jgi:hypothetical protein
MKKLVIAFIITAAIIMTGCVSRPGGKSLADMSPEEVSGTYKIVDEYKRDKAQGPLWFYLVRRDGGDWRELNYTREWGDNWQYSKNPTRDNIYYSLCSWESTITVQAGVKENSVYEVAVAFKVPFAGTIAIPDFAVVSHGAEDPGDDPPGPVAVTILKGSERLASTTIEGRTGTVTGVETNIGAGETVYIYVDPKGVEVTNVVFDKLVLNYKAE